MSNNPNKQRRTITHWLEKKTHVSIMDERYDGIYAVGGPCSVNSKHRVGKHGRSVGSSISKQAIDRF